MLFVDEVVPGNGRQDGSVRRSWLQVGGHGPALRLRDFCLLPGFGVDEEVPRWQNFQCPDWLYVGKVVMHMNLACDFFPYNFDPVLSNHFLGHGWKYSLCHIGAVRCG